MKPQMNADERGYEKASQRFVSNRRPTSCIVVHPRASAVLITVLALSVVMIGGCRRDAVERDHWSEWRGFDERHEWGPATVEEAMALIDERDEWTVFPPINIPRYPAEKHLAGMVIVIDPGHGGDDGGDIDPRTGHKRGPTGAREAHMNLRVAKLLRRLLTDAGVHVVMTREGDDSIGLRERAEIANTVKRLDGGIGADLFISIHHNAVGNPQTNYSSVWYHGQVDDAEVAIDAAKYVALEIGREMRTDVARTSPLFSDQLMYGTGFGVLRAARVPAFLCEMSFYTNPREEQRLRDAVYNLREAYAIYVGLCNWAYHGRPTQSLPEVVVDGSQVTLTTTLDEGLPKWWGADRPRILSSSVSVRVNGQTVPHEFDRVSKVVTATLPLSEQELAEAVVVSIHHANMFGNHNYPQRFEVKLPSEGTRATVTPIGPQRAEAQPTAAQ